MSKKTRRLRNQKIQEKQKAKTDPHSHEQKLLLSFIDEIDAHQERKSETFWELVKWTLPSSLVWDEKIHYTQRLMIVQDVF